MHVSQVGELVSRIVVAGFPAQWSAKCDVTRLHMALDPRICSVQIFVICELPKGRPQILDFLLRLSEVCDPVIGHPALSPGAHFVEHDDLRINLKRETLDTLGLKMI